MRYLLVSSVLFVLCLLPVLADDGAMPIWERTHEDVARLLGDANGDRLREDLKALS